MLVFKSADIETKFLPESELPASARLNSNEESPSSPPQATSSTGKLHFQMSYTHNSNYSYSIQYVFVQASTSTGSTVPASSSSGSQTFSEKTIENLVKLGFSRADVIDALRTSDGDENSAKIKLIAKSLTFPQSR